MISVKKNINGIILEATVEDGFEVNAKAFLGVFENIDLKNIPDGYKIQIGWTVFILADTPEGTKKILSPDYTNNPLKNLSEDLTLAIQIQEKQFEFLSAFKLKGEPTVFYSKIVCAKNVLEADKIYLHRTQKADKYDSGWYIGFADARKTPSPDELESIYAFELLYKKPSFVQFLLLPTDWMIVIENNSVIVVVNPDNENILH